MEMRVARSRPGVCPHGRPTSRSLDAAYADKAASMARQISRNTAVLGRECRVVGQCFGAEEMRHYELAHD